MSGNEVQVETRGDVAVLHIGSRLTLGEGDAALTSAVKALSKDESAPKTVVDLSKTTYMDSAGLGAIVAAYTSVTSSGGSLALAGLSPRVLDLLKMTKLDSVLPIYSSVEEAIVELQHADRTGA